MKKFIFKTFKYCAFCFIIINGISFFSQYVLKKSNLYKPSFLINQYKVDKQFDYITLGSSRGLTTLNTQQIDKSLETHGLNLSMDDTDLKSHLLMLNHFVKNGYKTKNCILTLDDNNFLATSLKLGNNDYKFVPFINQKHVKKHYNKYETQKLKPLYHADLFPFLSYSYFNLELFMPSIICLLNPNYRNRFDETGNYSYPKANKHGAKKALKKQTKSITNSLVRDIHQLCLENDINLIIYIAPYQNKEIAITDNPLNVINHSSSITDSKLFYDDIHVNKQGRTVATNNFINDYKNLTFE